MQICPRIHKLLLLLLVFEFPFEPHVLVVGVFSHLVHPLPNERGHYGRPRAVSLLLDANASQLLHLPHSLLVLFVDVCLQSHFSCLLELVSDWVFEQLGLTQLLFSRVNWAWALLLQRSRCIYAVDWLVNYLHSAERFQLVLGFVSVEHEVDVFRCGSRVLQTRSQIVSVFDLKRVVAWIGSWVLCRKERGLVHIQVWAYVLILSLLWLFFTVFNWNFASQIALKFLCPPSWILEFEMLFVLGWRVRAVCGCLFLRQVLVRLLLHWHQISDLIASLSCLLRFLLRFQILTWFPLPLGDGSGLLAMLYWLETCLLLWLVDFANGAPHGINR